MTPLDPRLAELEQLSEALTAARTALAQETAQLAAHLRLLAAARMPQIRGGVAQVAEAHARLARALDDCEDLFQSPKTRILHGNRLGFRQGRDTLEIPDEGATLARARQLLPADQAELLIRIQERLDKALALELDDDTQQRLGLIRRPGRNAPVIQPVDTDTDHTLKALLSRVQAWDEVNP